MTMLAYFSHSYRWQQKELNHRIWELLGSYFSFTVDPPDIDRPPMEVSALEDMMKHSACFIAVIPRRDDLKRQLCSPYQLFENGLAIRAHKPRLLFIEERLDKGLFGPPPEKLIRFRSSPLEFGPESDDIMDDIKELAQQAQWVAKSEVDQEDRIGLVLPDDGAYGAREEIRRLIEDDLERTVHWIDLSRFRGDSDLIGQVESCSVVIAETRTTWIPQDLLCLIHDRCVPMIRICQLRDGESVQKASAAMKLSRNSQAWSAPHPDFPVLFAGYKVGEEMEPVVFWKQSQELIEPIKSRLELIRRKPIYLNDTQKARNYFLQLGRVPGDVFISYESGLERLVTELRAKLLERGVESFQYTDLRAKDVIRGGDPDYRDALEIRIDKASIFLALINKAYKESEPCKQELRAALDRSQQGQLVIIPCLLEDTALPDAIRYVQALPLFDRDGPAEMSTDKLDIIVTNVVTNLEASERIKLEPGEREALQRAFAALDPDRLDLLLKEHLSNTRLSPREIEALFEHDEEGPIARNMLLDRLLDLARRSYLAASGSGRFLLHLAFDEAFATAKDAANLREALVRCTKRHQLLPDIRGQLTATRQYYETGILRFSDGSVTGTFDAIAAKQITGRHDMPEKLDEGLYATLVRVSATVDSWQQVVRDTGASLSRLTIVKEAMQKINERTVQGGDVDRANIGLCLFGDEKALEIPFEWYTREGSSAPMCLEHPVRRFLAGVESRRLPLRAALIHESPGPLRALLVGVNARDIPQVEQEVEDVGEELRKQFRQFGWPTGKLNVNVLTTRDVRIEQLYPEIREGGYDILHLAAHGIFQGDEPGILLRSNDEESKELFLSAQQLARWVSESKLRFVYLSSCQSATPESGRSQQVMRRFDNLIQGFVKAYVPEVLGFLWPIEDRESHRFAQEFYRHFLQDFRATTALLKARQQFPSDSRIWATSVLYSQCDTRYI